MRRTALPRVLSVGLLLALASCGETAVPTGPSTDPVSEVFQSQLGVGGSAARTFQVRDLGMVSVTLTTAGPPADVGLGVGIGVPTSARGGCNLSRSIVAVAAASPQLTAMAEGGSFCLRVFDVGNVFGEVSFSVTVVHP